jgi:hypothetical protein
MPKTHRDLLRRTVAQAANHIEEAQIDLLSVKAEFEPVHPDMAAFLDSIVAGMETMLGLVATFCFQAWGTAPADWDVWRNPGTHGKKMYEDPEQVPVDIDPRDS